MVGSSGLFEFINTFLRSSVSRWMAGEKEKVFYPPAHTDKGYPSSVTKSVPQCIAASAGISQHPSACYRSVGIESLLLATTHSKSHRWILVHTSRFRRILIESGAYRWNAAHIGGLRFILADPSHTDVTCRGMPRYHPLACPSIPHREMRCDTARRRRICTLK